MVSENLVDKVDLVLDEVYKKHGIIYGKPSKEVIKLVLEALGILQEVLDRLEKIDVSYGMPDK